MRIFVVAGIAFALVATTPAMAGHASPAEREATRQLNLQAAREAAPQQQQTAAQTQLPSEANMAANTPPSAAPTIRVQTAALGDAAH